MFFMLQQGGGGKQNAIDVDDYELQYSHDLVHESLKGLGGVPLAKELEEAERGRDGRLRDVLLYHRNLM